MLNALVAVERGEIAIDGPIHVRIREAEPVGARIAVLRTSHVAGVVAVGRTAAERAAEHAGRLHSLLVAAPLNAPDVRGGVDTQPAKAVDDDLAVALVSRACQVPLLEGKTLGVG